MSSSPQPRTFNDLLAHLRNTRGFDFTAYKQASLSRRVERRMQAVKVDSYDAYIDYLEVHPEEFTKLFNMLLINVTSFFRDTAAWDVIANEVVPAIIARKPPDEPIRVWSAGCASGQEPYTIAMLLVGALGREAAKQRVKIYATDVDDEALMQARQASYPARDVEANVPAPLIQRYFERVGQADTYVLDRDVRRVVIFGKHDLLKDPPVSRVSLITCRNCLMYMNADAQSRVLQSLHFGLEQEGVLFLGKAEMMFSRQDLFRPLDLRRRIFLRSGPSLLPARSLDVPGIRDQQALTRRVEHPNLRALAFASDAIPQVAIDVTGTLVLANDRARTLFHLTENDIGRSLRELEISHRPFQLMALVERALNQRYTFTEADIEVRDGGRETAYYDLYVTPLIDHTGELQGVSLTFRDVTRFHVLQDALKHSHQELETAYEEIQSTNEELETTNEELQSSNEELETTNEELQSTNEELETMNEELQATNEELQNANQELKFRGDELDTANSFLEAILSSMADGVIVLDDELRVLAWNSKSEDFWGLRAAEVKGRSLLALDIGLPTVQVTRPVQEAMAGGKPSALTVAAVNRRGKPVEVQVSASRLAAFGPANSGGVVLLMSEVAAGGRSDADGSRSARPHSGDGSAGRAQPAPRTTDGQS